MTVLVLLFMPYRGEETVSTEQKQDKWKYDGVRVVKGNELDTNTPQTPGMQRAAAITYARCGAEKLWAGTVVTLSCCLNDGERQLAKEKRTGLEIVRDASERCIFGIYVM